VLRPGETVLCIPVYSHDQKGHPMHATETDFATLDDDLRLVTLPDAARFLSVSRGSLYDLLTTGQLASVHIGRWASSAATSASASTVTVVEVPPDRNQKWGAGGTLCVLRTARNEALRMSTGRPVARNARRRAARAAASTAPLR
jgi:hypothetical protein